MVLVKRLALALTALVVLLLIANFVMQARTELQLQARIAAIRAAGDPASIADLAPVPIPDGQNAAAAIERTAARLAAFSHEEFAFEQSEIGVAYQQANDRGEPPTQEQLAAVRALMSSFADVDSALTTAAACPQYASRLDFSLDQPQFLNQIMKQLTTYRTASRFLDLRMTILTADGKSDEAVEKGINSLQLARLHEAEPAFINFLVTIAMRSIATEALYDALAAGPISPELHAALDAELARADDPQQFVQVLKSERAFNIGSFDDLAAGSAPYLSHVIGWPIKSQCIGVLDWYDQELVRAGQPTKTTAGPSPNVGNLATLMTPALQAVHTAAARGTIRIRALRVFNALTQFRDQHGREATGLDELTLPRDATIDPYSGQPLKLKHTDDGWIIYSVMENGTDDDGDFTDMKDDGLAPPRQRSVASTPTNEPE